VVTTTAIRPARAPIQRCQVHKPDAPASGPAGYVWGDYLAHLVAERAVALVRHPRLDCELAVLLLDAAALRSVGGVTHCVTSA
jgi:hypothetical protein